MEEEIAKKTLGKGHLFKPESEKKEDDDGYDPCSDTTSVVVTFDLHKLEQQIPTVTEMIKDPMKKGVYRLVVSLPTPL
jgi:hypothetical protein